MYLCYLLPQNFKILKQKVEMENNHQYITLIRGKTFQHDEKILGSRENSQHC